MIPYAVTLGERLQKMRITQAELAQEARMFPSQLSRWLTTEMEPRAKQVERLERALARICARRIRARARTSR